MHSDAIFSSNQKCRFLLSRIWDSNKEIVCYIGLNPSIANKNQNDRTVEKLIKISRFNNIGGFHLLNVFPIISTDPKELRTKYGIGKRRNREYLKKYINEHRTICIWGNHATINDEHLKILNQIEQAYCLKKNKTGMPSHPLYLPLKTKIVKY